MSPVGRTVNLSTSQVVTATRKLYAEGVKPFGRILRKIVAEDLDEPRVALVDPQELLEVCHGCELLKVEEEGGDWSVCLLDTPQEGLVDSHSLEDHYSDVFWRQAAEYFGSLSADDVLPGGRYMCAKVLHSRGLPFLQGFSMGQVCHVVQLAEKRHQLLGYRDGALVAFKHSQSKHMQECARAQVPSGEDSAVTLQQFCVHLRDMLERAGGRVPLSNIKRHMLQQCGLQVCQTAFGFARFRTFMEEHPQIQEFCKVIRDNKDYFVRRRSVAPPQLFELASFLDATVTPQRARGAATPEGSTEDSAKSHALSSNGTSSWCLTPVAMPPTLPTFKLELASRLPNDVNSGCSTDPEALTSSEDQENDCEETSGSDDGYYAANGSLSLSVVRRLADWFSPSEPEPPPADRANVPFLPFLPQEAMRQPARVTGYDMPAETPVAGVRLQFRNLPFVDEDVQIEDFPDAELEQPRRVATPEGARTVPASFWRLGGLRTGPTPRVGEFTVGFYMDENQDAELSPCARSPMRLWPRTPDPGETSLLVDDDHSPRSAATPNALFDPECTPIARTPKVLMNRTPDDTPIYRVASPNRRRHHRFF